MAKKEKKKAAKKEPSPKPRQKRLPTMDDPKIEELHGLAEEYADARDKRMALTETEHNLKENLLKAMHRHDMKHYHYNGLDIEVVPEAETVKVRIEKGKE